MPTLHPVTVHALSLSFSLLPQLDHNLPRNFGAHASHHLTNHASNRMRIPQITTVP